MGRDRDQQISGWQNVSPNLEVYGSLPHYQWFPNQHGGTPNSHPFRIDIFHYKTSLVGGWATPLKNMKVNGKDDNPFLLWQIKKSSKPPASNGSLTINTAVCMVYLLLTSGSESLRKSVSFSMVAPPGQPGESKTMWQCAKGLSHIYIYVYILYVYTVYIQNIHVPSGNLTVCYWQWHSRNSWFTH